ncbi:hypothetical protein [Methylobacterium sp. GC_Met_2]|uniref:hypothetical protein n=1 Tax=Methylobacterium sp. GC_Met_2 TaxID=2937376 RepID=UPI00226B4153|nr:hypothetical protein [Methylobacterium sp. GC_Met_2]
MAQTAGHARDKAGGDNPAMMRPGPLDRACPALPRAAMLSRLAPISQRSASQIFLKASLGVAERQNPVTKAVSSLIR